jgi:hypothetical protein
VTTLLAAPGEPAQSFDEDNEPVVTWIDYSSRETGFVVEYEVDYDKWVQLGPTVPASSGTGKTVKLSLAGLNLYGEYVVRVRAIGLNGRYSEFAYTLGKF